MRKVSFLFLLVFPFILFSWDASVHVYLSMNMKDIWEDYDPEFYDMLNTTPYSITDPTPFLVQKFYYIGTTLPDMFDWQENIRTAIEFLYTANTSILDAFRGLNITEITYVAVQNFMEFTGGARPVNQSIGKLREMVEYAKSQNWSPYKKALIYGCYAHLLEDIIAHIILQPITYGYGKTIDAPDVIDVSAMVGSSCPLLGIGEPFQELFSATNIPEESWNAMEDILFSGVKMEGSYYSYFRCPFHFYQISDILGRNYAGFQDSTWLPIHGFVEAANAVGYNISNLTHDRLRAYIHGWSLLLFILYGYNEEFVGGVVGHPEWTPENIIEYLENISFENVNLSSDSEFFSNFTSRTMDYLAKGFIVRAIALFISGADDFTSFDLLPWPEYFLSGDNLDKLKDVAQRLGDYDEVVELFTKAENIIDFYNEYGTVKRPNLRTTYSDQLTEAIKFKGY